MSSTRVPIQFSIKYKMISTMFDGETLSCEKEISGFCSFSLIFSETILETANSNFKPIYHEYISLHAKDYKLVF